MEVTMNAIDLSTPVKPGHFANAVDRDDCERAISVRIARSLTIALIFATLGFTEWYASAIYGNALVSAQEYSVARVEHLPARYAVQAMEFDDQ